MDPASLISVIIKAIILLVLILFIIALIKGFISIYNQLVSKRQAVNGRWADVDAFLQKRMDLIPNLVETVKGYAKHEKETLTEVQQARSAATNSFGATDPVAIAEAMKKQSGLAGALSKLMMVTENYPDLKANANFQDLQNKLSNIETEISSARELYNSTVEEYNAYLLSFVTNIVNMFSLKYKEMPFFKADDTARVAPKVVF
ncbi:LemA family protein [Francisella philomiragia]|uniref:LemA family protein n=1 Tax=Francisella philomiragia TaxID=28110 RepID=UPI0019039F02|nr:LemA family protein [Francisella philomiragia]MBK2268299.1 LemA family protein [Francisella philomiragia]MBK2279706.1 LemA family protein [Francisella philomiragia]MBK2287610.1 LemA family protein [Francisella philomiragia]MBK2289589.1 LemA family protein [Francisella philomiragia]MBK2291487.1 LemA family protein [Francisella philomiragia]